MPEPMPVMPLGRLLGRHWLQITSWMRMGSYIAGPVHHGFTTFQWFRHEALTIQELQSLVNGRIKIWDGQRIQDVQLVNRNEYFALFINCLPPLANARTIRSHSCQPTTEWLRFDRRVVTSNDVHATFIWLLSQEAAAITKGDERSSFIVRRNDGRLALFRA